MVDIAKHLRFDKDRRTTSFVDEHGVLVVSIPYVAEIEHRGDTMNASAQLRMVGGSNLHAVLRSIMHVPGCDFVVPWEIREDAAGSHSIHGTLPDGSSYRIICPTRIQHCLVAMQEALVAVDYEETP